MRPADFLALGIAVIPVLPRSKRPAVRWFQYQHTLPSQVQLARWFRPGRSINAAVVCGWNGLTVLDFDTLPGYTAWRAWAISQGGEARQVALDSYRVKTARGIHLYLFVAEVPRCGHHQWGDIKARGGYVLIPPSVHPSGAVYTAVDDSQPILRVASLEGILPDAPKPVVAIPQPTRVYSASNLWPMTVIDEIKARVSILEYFAEAKQTGSHWYVTACPFHDDKNPSMWIDTEKGICGCYTGCTDKPLDVIDLHSRLFHCSAKETIKELRGRL